MGDPPAWYLPDMRSRFPFLAGLVVVVLLTAAGTTETALRPASAQPEDPGVRCQVRTDGTWQPISSAGAPRLEWRATAGWTGHEVLVWGNTDWNPRDRTYGATIGARYMPEVDTWVSMSSEGAPSPRQGAAEAWTGTELLMWSGHAAADRGNVLTYLADGARYHAASDTWFPLSGEGAPSPRSGALTVWTGQELVIWGGGADASAQYMDGGAYDPRTDAWRPLSPTPESLGDPTSVVWTGSEVLFWNARAQSPRPVGRWNPQTDTWAVDWVEAPFTSRFGEWTFWTGTQLLMWGGQGTFPAFNDGGLYDPVTQVWQPISQVGAPAPRSSLFGSPVVWTGHQLVVWGGAPPDWHDGRAVPPRGDGAVYDLDSDRWYPLPPAPLEARSAHRLVWTGDSVFIFGGVVGPPPGRGWTIDGSRYLAACPVDVPDENASVTPEGGRTEPTSW
jgi:hypothetical protein